MNLVIVVTNRLLTYSKEYCIQNHIIKSIEGEVKQPYMKVFKSLIAYLRYCGNFFTNLHLFLLSTTVKVYVSLNTTPRVKSLVSAVCVCEQNLVKN